MIPGCVGWRDAPVRSTNDSTQLAWPRLCPSTNALCERGLSAGPTTLLRITKGSTSRVTCPWKDWMHPLLVVRWRQFRWVEEAPLPVWAATLGEALFTPCYDMPPGVCDAEHPIPFEDLLLPFLHIYLRRLVDEASAGYGCLLPAAQRSLARSLLGALSALTRDALYAEFCHYRLVHFAPLAPFVWAEPDALYRRFVGHMQSGGLLAFFELHPVLGRRLAEQPTNTPPRWVNSCVGLWLICRHCSGCGRWRTRAGGRCVAGLSDPHRGGRQVFAVTFANGRRLIYKPKDMGIDVAYNALLTWLNAAGAPITLRPLLVLDRQTHGWVECADPAPCADRAAVTRYYHRAGALMCLVHLLQGSDCHAENLIAAGEDPVLVDCETLLDPWPRWPTGREMVIAIEPASIA